MEPIIVFVLSWHQCCMVMDNLLLYCTADNDPNWFLNVDEVNLQLHLDYISDSGLTECLKHGVGYYHESQVGCSTIEVEEG